MAFSQLAVVACTVLAAVLLTGVAANNYSVPLGGRCNFTANCSTNYSECLGGVCHCPVGRVSSVYYNACLFLTQAVNGSCSEPAQCSGLANTACLLGRCACANGFVYYSGSCIYPSNAPSAPAAPPSSPVRCSANSDCRHIRNAECSSGACVCRRGYRPTPDGQNCSAGAGLRSLVAIVLLSLLFTKVTA